MNPGDEVMCISTEIQPCPDFDVAKWIDPLPDVGAVYIVTKISTCCCCPCIVAGREPNWPIIWSGDTAWPMCWFRPVEYDEEKVEKRELVDA